MEKKKLYFIHTNAGRFIMSVDGEDNARIMHEDNDNWREFPQYNGDNEYYYKKLCKKMLLAVEDDSSWDNENHETYEKLKAADILDSVGIPEGLKIIAEIEKEF